MIAPKPKTAMPPLNRPMPTLWTDRVRGATETALDSESSISLACYLSDVFDRAETWTALIIDLAKRGFSLRFEHERLALINDSTGASICTCASLGRNFASLTARLGKPSVEAASGRLIPRSARAS